MAVYADASRTPLDQAARWLFAAVRALLGGAFISINVMLPFSHLPEMPAAGRVLLVAASILSAGTGLVLLLWAADTIRARAEPMDDGIYDQLLLDAYRRYGMSKHFAPPALSISDRGRLGERIRATKRAQKVRGEYLGGPPPFGWAYTRRASSYRCREQQAALKRIRTLAAKGLSPYKISADLKARGTPLSHVTVREVIASRRSPTPRRTPCAGHATPWQARY